VNFDYRLPGTGEPVITVRRTALGGIRVLVDGIALKGRRGVYGVPGADGQVHLLRVTGAWTGLRAIADGADTALEPPVPLWARVLMLLPLLLVIGGLVGATLGVIGVALNGVIGRSPLRLPVRIVAMLLVAVVAGAGWLGIGAALTSLGSAHVSYTTGTCLEGITSSTDLVSQAPRPVDCGTAHDGEVVGTFSLDAATVYPGNAGLRSAAGQGCPPLFAAYVGIDFTASALDILPVVPTGVAWQAGTREISCVALTTDGSKLTGSVKGTGR
jgi:hypothetical protein